MHATRGWALTMAVGLGIVGLACGPGPAPNTSPPSRGASVVTDAPTAASVPAETAVPSPTASPPAVVRMAFPSPSIAALPYWVAKDAGLFARQGVNMELTRIQGSSAATAALLAGEVQAVGEGAAAVLAHLEGGDLVLVASPVTRFGFSVISQPGVRQPDDLRGGRVGVTRFGTGTDFALRYALSEWGLAPDRDVVIIQTGGVPESLAAVQSGAVLAGVTSDPTTARARAAGLHILANLSELPVEYPQISLVVRRQYITDQPTVVARLVQAVSEAIHLIKTDPASSLRSLREHTGIDDTAILEDVYARWRDQFQEKPYPRVEAIKTVVEELAESRPEVRRLDPASVVEPAFVRRLDEAGFYETLYRGTTPMPAPR